MASRKCHLSTPAIKALEEELKTERAAAESEAASFCDEAKRIQQASDSKAFRLQNHKRGVDPKKP